MSIELPILGFLKEEPMHGYELMQRLYVVLGFAWQPSYGALYPMLRKLEVRGLVTHTNMQKGHGPPKRVYSLTDNGMLRFRDLMLSKRTSNGLPLQIIFLDHLETSERKGILLRICEQREKELERLEKRGEQAKFMSKYQQSVVNYGLKSLRQELDWMKGLALDEE